MRCMADTVLASGFATVSYRVCELRHLRDEGGRITVEVALFIPKTMVLHNGSRNYYGVNWVRIKSFRKLQDLVQTLHDKLGSL